MRFFCALSFLVFSLNAFAATVTVSMAQNGGAPSAALEMTRVIEEQIMNDYFISGEIISNTEIIENGFSSYKKNESLIAEAAEGMSDFLLSVYLEYDTNEKRVSESGSVYAALKKVEWQVVDVQASKIVGSGSFTMKESEIQQNNPYECARVAAGVISRESLKIQHDAEEGKR